MGLMNDVRLVTALLKDAEHQAHGLGDEIPGAEHLVLAALDSADESGRVLLGVGANQFRRALVAVHDFALEEVGVPPGLLPTLPATASAGPYHSEGSLGEVLDRARLLAKRSRPRGLRTEHIIRAAAEREMGTTSRAFDQLRIDRDSLL